MNVQLISEVVTEVHTILTIKVPHTDSRKETKETP